MRKERFVAISTLDPALDTERMTWDDLGAYTRTRDPGKILPFVKPGEFPTTYHLRECPSVLWSWVMAAGDNDAERCERAFRACVERVDNLYQRDGARLDSWAPTTTNGTPRPMGDDEIARFPRSHIAEIGMVAFEHSFLERRIEGCFRLPALLVEQLVRRTFRPAESSQPSAEGTSSGKPSGTSGQIQGTTGSGNETVVAACD